MTLTARADEAAGNRLAVARLAWASTALILVGQLWLVFHRDLNVDEYEHVHAAWCMAGGLIPYRDFFEHHTPWLYFLFAPLVTRFAAETDPAAAFRLLMACRLAMWAATVLCIALIAELARSWRDRMTGALAAFLTASSIQFLDVMLEFRPDVPALVCWLVSLVCAVRGWRACRSGPACAWFGVCGAAFAASLLFTQKYVFAMPGVALMLAWYVLDPRAEAPIDRRGRLAAVAVFVAAVFAPLAATAAWFASRGALHEFVYYNFEFNVQQNAVRFSPLPLLVSNLVHSPALIVLGSIGLWRAPRSRLGNAGTIPVLASTAASLAVGLVLFGRVYGQYLVMFFPHLAVFAAAQAPDLVTRAAAWLPARRGLTVVLVLIPPAAALALLIGLDHPASPAGLIMLASFTGASALGALAIGHRSHGHGTRSALLAILALATMTAGNAARIFRSNASQLTDLAYVTTHTRPGDEVLGSGVAVGAGAFRPHAWFFFFSPALAPGAEVADMVMRVTSGRLRPQIIAFDKAEGGPPPGLQDYIDAHYRLVRGSLYERLPD